MRINGSLERFPGGDAEGLAPKDRRDRRCRRRSTRPSTSSCNRAKAGDADALGCLLESYRAYLKLIAGSLLRTASRASVDVSDVVQETNLKACGNFPTFRGSDEPELVAWLRQILMNLVLNLLKKQGSTGPTSGVAGGVARTGQRGGSLGPGGPGVHSQRPGIATGAGGVDGQRPGVVAGGLPASPGLVLSGESPAQGNRPADGPLRRGVADAADASREGTGTETTGTGMNLDGGPNREDDEALVPEDIEATLVYDAYRASVRGRPSTRPGEVTGRTPGARRSPEDPDRGQQPVRVHRR